MVRACSAIILAIAEKYKNVSDILQKNSQWPETSACKEAFSRPSPKKLKMSLTLFKKSAMARNNQLRISDLCRSIKGSRRTEQPSLVFRDLATTFLDFWAMAVFFGALYPADYA